MTTPSRCSCSARRIRCSSPTREPEIAETIASDIGRSLHRIPGTHRVSFVRKVVADRVVDRVARSGDAQDDATRSTARRRRGLRVAARMDRSCAVAIRGCSGGREGRRRLARDRRSVVRWREGNHTARGERARRSHRVRRGRARRREVEMSKRREHRSRLFGVRVLRQSVVRSRGRTRRPSTSARSLGAHDCFVASAVAFRSSQSGDGPIVCATHSRCVNACCATRSTFIGNSPGSGRTGKAGTRSVSLSSVTSYLMPPFHFG